MNKRIDWIVCLYNKDDDIIESYIIEDRSEHEAVNEVKHYVETVEDCRDWSIEIFNIKNNLL